VYLQLTERDFKVPGWLLSSGTLRILALWQLLRHPTPPPLIAIEEIENGLDPRTVHLLVEEIRVAVESGKTQSWRRPTRRTCWTSCRYRAWCSWNAVDGEPRFTRPADSEEVQHWAKRLAPRGSSTR